MKIAICDDSREILQQMGEYINQAGTDLNVPFSLFTFASGEELLNDMPSDTDVLFLDIRMNGINGIDAALKLRQSNPDFYLIFITSNLEYALDGYQAHAYAFLPKPLTYSAVKRQIAEIYEKISRKDTAMFEMRFNGEVTVYRCQDVIYLEVFRHELNVVTGHERKHYAESLSVMEERLKREGFFRCHKAYLVNLAHVSGYSSTTLTMDNGDNVPLSKHRLKGFLDAFTAYQGNML